jgi:putative NIF3 family GTP cyclohydrolase 1 type 2
VDAFVTADLGHHVAAEFVADPVHPVLVDVAHWASEWPWLPAAAELLTEAFGTQLAVTVSTRRTDPWTARGSR